MDELHKKKCVACEGSIPSFDLDEIHKYLKKVDGWQVKSDSKEKYFLNNKCIDFYPTFFVIIFLV